ncbi:MAG: segregation/condensation protein A [Candidatus Pacearchaeota archaeon]|jgi:segregation and condensation protein A
MEKEEHIEQKVKPSVSQDQVHDILFSREIGWQEIIYDLIHTEQLDPWDINIGVLTDKFFEKIQEYEEMDFFVSSKVLLAASLLLRIKSEFLLNKYIKSIDEILFGEKEKKKVEFERIELDEDIPLLMPKSPIPRYKRVTLQELIGALSKAIVTENRRIKKEIVNTNALRESGISLPKKRFNLKDKLKEIHEKLLEYFNNNKEEKKITYTALIGEDREQRIASFFPLLQLENNKQIWLEQEAHFEEINVWLKDVFFRENPDFFKDLITEEILEIEEEIRELDEEDLDEELEEDEKIEKNNLSDEEN